MEACLCKEGCRARIPWGSWELEERHCLLGGLRAREVRPLKAKDAEGITESSVENSPCAEALLCFLLSSQFVAELELCS